MTPPAPCLPILYSYRRCPYAMRARMALRYSGITVDIQEISLKNKPPHMLAVSPKGTVPVLVLPDGEVIEESLAIMQWALNQHDPDQWMAHLPVALFSQGAALIAENDGSFKQALDRYKYAVRFPEHSAEFYRAQSEPFLAMLERHLAQQLYLLGNTMTLADVAIFPFIRQFAAVDQAWFDESPYPQLKRWLAGLLASALFKGIMEKLASQESSATIRQAVV